MLVEAAWLRPIRLVDVFIVNATKVRRRESAIKYRERDNGLDLAVKSKAIDRFRFIEFLAGTRKMLKHSFKIPRHLYLYKDEFFLRYVI